MTLDKTPPGKTSFEI
jgi:hypothetical protein